MARSPRPPRRDRHRSRSAERSSRRHRSGSPDRPSRRHRSRSHSPSSSHASHRRRLSPSRRASPPPRPRRASPPNRSPSPPPHRSRAPLPDQDALRPAPRTFNSQRGPSRRDDFRSDTGAVTAPPTDEPPVEKQKPNFAPTGLLAAASNTVNNVALKYSEPADARLPPRDAPKWKLFVFKDKEIVDTIELGEKSCWLVGRDRAVVDLPVDHPSCSKQHAVWQFRWVSKVDEFGERKGRVRLYIMDLESANGTRLGGVRLEGGRFVEVLEGDLVTFAESTREYVVMIDRG